MQDCGLFFSFCYTPLHYHRRDVYQIRTWFKIEKVSRDLTNFCRVSTRWRGEMPSLDFQLPDILRRSFPRGPGKKMEKAFHFLTGRAVHDSPDHPIRGKVKKTIPVAILYPFIHYPGTEFRKASYIPHSRPSIGRDCLLQ
jgi:hypothetical protein